MFDLSGHAALITGSTRGIGAAIAEAYAEHGADVVIHGRSDLNDRTRDLLQRCRSKGVKADYVQCDIGGPVEQVVEELYTGSTAICPNIDILVHTAGGHQGEGYFFDVELELFERTMRLHVTLPFFLTQRFARQWHADGVAGRMVVIGSVNGTLAEPGSSAYDTSKGGQSMLVRTLAVDLARKNIRVNGLAPGMVLTDRTQWAVEYPVRGEWVKYNTPNGLLPGPDSCTGAAVFLVSDEAYHVHGHMLMVDGGIAAWQYPEAPETGEVGFPPPM